MKKLFFTLITVLAAGTAAFSQTKGKTEVGFGAGLNLASVLSDNDIFGTNYNYRAGVNIGVSADHYFSDKWSIKVKGMFEQRGWATKFDTSLGIFKPITKLDYVTVPVMANWHFGHTRNWYLNFGPYASFLLNKPSASSFNDVDAGLDLGIGIKFPISDRAKIFIEFNAEGGGVSLNTSGTALRNSTSAFNVGFNF